MKNKKNIILIVSFALIALIAFYAGTAYSNSKKVASFPGGTQGQFSKNGMMGQKGTRAGGGNLFGKIIAKDANSITVELSSPAGQNGTNNTNTGTGSKIVFYTDKTTVLKTTDGLISDLVIGKDVTIQGTANTDGSVSAQNISIRPTIENNTKN